MNMYIIEDTIFENIITGVWRIEAIVDKEDNTIAIKKREWKIMIPYRHIILNIGL